MFNFLFYNPVNKNLNEYIKKTNEISFNKRKQTHPTNNQYQINTNDYDFDLCSLSECSDDNEGSDAKDCSHCKNKRKNIKDDEKYICNCAHNKFISSLILYFIGGTSIASLSLLYYKFYIKK
jgi:hypothetical protein